MQDFEDLMETVTVKRITFADDENKARQEEHETAFEILANIQPIHSASSGNTATERTLTKGSYALGEILIITLSELQDTTSGKPDIVIYDSKKYEVFVKKTYKEPLQHFEYICSLKI